jgi:hypothetical protein
MTITPPSCICIDARRALYYTFFHIDDLCLHYCPLLSSEYSVYCSYRMVIIITITIPSVAANRYSIVVDILCLISVVEMVFNRLSNVRLLGMDTNPQATTSLWLYWQQFILRKVCNALLEFSRNHHTCTIKHLRTMIVGEYTYTVYHISSLMVMQ